MGKNKVATKSGDVAEKAAGVSAPKTSGKKSKKIEQGKVYVNASYNNTVVTVTDNGGNVVAWASAGSLGFSGPKKATPFASSKVIAALVEKLQNNGPKDIAVIVKGIGSGRDSTCFRSRMLPRFRITVRGRRK
jgi:small subunit ribosomal protein S11